MNFSGIKIRRAFVWRSGFVPDFQISLKNPLKKKFQRFSLKNFPLKKDFSCLFKTHKV